MIFPVTLHWLHCQHNFLQFISKLLQNLLGFSKCNFASVITIHNAIEKIFFFVLHLDHIFLFTSDPWLYLPTPKTWLELHVQAQVAWTKKVRSIQHFLYSVFHFTVIEKNTVLLAPMWYGSKSHKQGVKSCQSHLTTRGNMKKLV